MSFPRYPEYKTSGVPWLGQVPVGWAVRRLRFAASLNPSKNEIAATPRDMQVSFLPMEAIGDDGALNLERTRPVGEMEAGYTYFREGDVAVAKITPCFENGKGAVMRGLVGGIGFGTTELIVARPRAAESSADYLYWLFSSAPFRALGEASMYGAGGQKRVPDDFFHDFATAWPQLEEQRAIAAFLDRETRKIDSLVAEQERLIELLKEKRQAVISHAVTKGLNPDAPLKPSGIEWLGNVPAHWDIRPIKGIVSVPVTDGPHETPEFLDHGVPFVSAEAVSSGALDFAKIRGYISPKDQERYAAKYVPRRGDIYMVKSGATTGVTALVETDDEFNIWSPLAAIRCNETVMPRFLLHYMRSRNFLDGVTLGWSFGTQQNIGMGVIENLAVPVPPLWEQEALVARLDRLAMAHDGLVRESEKVIGLLGERRSALISAAVTGQIDVRGLV